MSTPAPDEVQYLLINFAALFSVAIGFNVVFTVWDGLREQAAKKFNIIAKDMRESVALRLGSKFPRSRAETELDNKIAIHKKRLARFSFLSKIIGIIICGILLSLLIAIGFWPLATTSKGYLILIIIISVLFSPFMILLGNLLVLYSKHKLNEFVEQISISLDDYERMAREAKDSNAENTI